MPVSCKISLTSVAPLKAVSHRFCLSFLFMDEQGDASNDQNRKWGNNDN